jgi:hypothetical protein
MLAPAFFYPHAQDRPAEMPFYFRPLPLKFLTPGQGSGI